MSLAVAASSLLPGIFGLGGVGLGGVLSFLSTRGVERRREARESLQTLRLAKAELGGEVLTILDEALKYESWPAGWQGATWDESWASYRQILASTLDDGDFATIARPYQRMVALQSGLSAGKRELDKGRRRPAREQPGAEADRLAPGEAQTPADSPAAAEQAKETDDRVFLESLRAEVKAAGDRLESLVALRERERAGARPWRGQH
jgi:hypothetical protein